MVTTFDLGGDPAPTSIVARLLGTAFLFGGVGGKETAARALFGEVVGSLITKVDFCESSTSFTETRTAETTGMDCLMRRGLRDFDALVFGGVFGVTRTAVGVVGLVGAEAALAIERATGCLGKLTRPLGLGTSFLGDGGSTGTSTLTILGGNFELRLPPGGGVGERW